MKGEINEVDKMEQSIFDKEGIHCVKFNDMCTSWNVAGYKRL